MYTRRDIAKMAFAAPLAAAAFGKVNSKISGVMIGAQTYSFRDMPLDAAIKAMQKIGLGYAELWQGHIEPKNDKEAAKWRATVSMDVFKEVRKKFDDAGVQLYAYNYSFRDNFSDAEIERGFEMAHALGVDKLTASANVSTAKRIDPFAEKNKVYVGMHNHDSMKKNEFSTPDDWKEAMAGRSKYIVINLDIGHFTAAGFDPVSFLEEHHSHIVTLHVKDRKRNHDGVEGKNMPLGQGETNIKGVLQLLKTKKYPIPANIEYEYGEKGMDTVAEVTKCFEYCKAALA